jgi:hypothetical protein
MKLKIYLGSDSQVLRVLTSAATAGSSMTLESCAAFCSKYTYFGTEYADEVCRPNQILSEIC